MAIPLLVPILAGGAGLAGLSFFSDEAADKTVDVAGDVIEESVEVLGVAMVRGVQGAIRAIRQESKGHGVEISATITVMLISYFFFKNFIVPPGR